MQRKNNLLKIKSSRNGIAMIMAVAVIVIMATLMALALSMTAKTSKNTIDLYLYEQAQLIAKSAAEVTLLYISLENNETNPCHVQTLDFTENSIYDVNVTVKYSYTSYPATCPASVRFAPVTTPEQNGSVLLDITVSVDDATVTTEPIRYFRRSIQKL